MKKSLKKKVKEQIIRALQKAINSASTSAASSVPNGPGRAGSKEIRLEFPEREEFGDYSTNIAMILVKKDGKNPRELAEEIVFNLQKDKELIKIVDKIEVAGPGFINFFLSKEALLANLEEILTKKESYGQSDILAGKRIMIEYGQPNTHKLPHIGHLFSYLYGESLTRILEAGGATIFRANYQGDVGLQVAKCLWAWQKENPNIPVSLEDKVNLLQKMYVIGSNAYAEDETAKTEIDKINKRIYKENTTILDLWQETRGWSVDYYQKFEERLGIRYDKYYFESEVYKEGVKIVKENVGTVFKESQGAIIFEGSKYGLHDRVFLTKHDTPTYEAKDMALENIKMRDWHFDLLIITTANEQNDYFRVIFKALEILDPKFKGKLKHIGFGMVNLKTGKISSREGNIIGAVELVDITVDEVRKLVKDEADLNKEEKDQISEAVGIGAVKYSFLKNNPLQNVKFDLEESISKEGNSGPYLQYTFARCRSVLRKAGDTGDIPDRRLETIPYRNRLTLRVNEEELAILRTIYKFSEVIQDAGKSFSPNLLCNFLFGLAQKFNLFYARHRIIQTARAKSGNPTPEVGLADTFGVYPFRLALTSATGQVLKNGLKLLDIQTPVRM